MNMVDYKKIEDVCQNIFAGGTPNTKRADYYDGSIPWIRSGEVDFNEIRNAERNISELGFKNSSAKLIREGSVVMAMTGATVAKSAIVEFETSANQSVCALVTNEDIVTYRFLYYVLAKNYFLIKSSAQGALTSLNLSMIKQIEIPVPPLPVQQEIVRILDTFTQLLSNLETELAARQKQYEYYRNKLLTFDKDDDSVEWKALGDICEKVSKIKWKSEPAISVYLYIDLSSVTLDTHLITKAMRINRGNAPSRAQQIVKEGDVLLGTTRPTMKRYCLVNENYDGQICSTGYCVFRPKENVSHSKWIYHNIAYKHFWKYCENMQKGASYPSLANSDAFAYEIPIPSLQRQQEIVSILDTFESLITNLKKEIELRRKQYEYYREKLLTFE